MKRHSSVGLITNSSTTIFYAYRAMLPMQICIPCFNLKALGDHTIGFRPARLIPPPSFVHYSEDDGVYSSEFLNPDDDDVIYEWIYENFDRFGRLYDEQFISCPAEDARGMIRDGLYKDFGNYIMHHAVGYASYYFSSAQGELSSLRDMHKITSNINRLFYYISRNELVAKSIDEDIVYHHSKIWNEKGRAKFSDNSDDVITIFGSYDFIISVSFNSALRVYCAVYDDIKVGGE